MPPGLSLCRMVNTCVGDRDHHCPSARGRVPTARCLPAAVAAAPLPLPAPRGCNGRSTRCFHARGGAIFSYARRRGREGERESTHTSEDITPDEQSNTERAVWMETELFKSDVPPSGCRRRGGGGLFWGRDDDVQTIRSDPLDAARAAAGGKFFLGCLSVCGEAATRSTGARVSVGECPLPLLISATLSVCPSPPSPPVGPCPRSQGPVRRARAGTWSSCKSAARRFEADRSSGGCDARVETSFPGVPVSIGWPLRVALNSSGCKTRLSSCPRAHAHG